MPEANFLTIAHFDQKGISKIIKIYTSKPLLVDWRMSNVLQALFFLSSSIQKTPALRVQSWNSDRRS